MLMNDKDAMKNFDQSRRCLWLITSLLSMIFALSLVFLVYIQYLQSYNFSVKRILFGSFIFIFLFLIFYAGFRLISKKFLSGDCSKLIKVFGFWLLVASLLSPCFLPVAYYPVSPLFQQKSNIKIIFHFPEGKGKLFQLKGLRLKSGDTEYSPSSFHFSDGWVKNSEKYFLDTSLQGEIYWEGKIAERSRLTIRPMETAAQVTVLWDGEIFSAPLVDTPLNFLKEGETPNWYYILIAVLRTVCVGCFLFFFFSMYSKIENSKHQEIIAGGLLIFLCLYTVYAQFENIEIKGRIDMQMERHQAVISGQALNPWQYRVLAEWLIEGLARLAGFMRLSQPYFYIFVLLRITQNTLIYFLLYLYYRKLGHSISLTLVGLLFVTGSLVNSFHQSDLSFNTYFDVIFYLSASLLILNSDLTWLPMLILAASLNRETSGLIPILALSLIPNPQKWKKQMPLVLLLIFIWVGVFIFLRLLYPNRDLFIPYGYHPGIPLFTYNLSPLSFNLLFRFFGFVPLLGLVVFDKWSPLLKRFFVIMVPIWLLIHLLGSVITETRVFLVPHVLVFVPTFLLFIQPLWMNNAIREPVD